MNWKLLLLFAFALFPNSLLAQAWVPNQGDGSINFAYQGIYNTYHRLSDGSVSKTGKSENVGLYLDADYAVTDRFSLSAGIPYLFGKYTDPSDPPAQLPFLPVDSCRCWNYGWQDFGFTARYNIANGNFALTPSLSIGTPSNNYDFQGEAALGRQLTEARIAVDVGKRLDSISRNMYVQGSYSYAFVERVIDIGTNRSNAGIEVGYLLTNSLLVRGLSVWQRTHGGLRSANQTPDGMLIPLDVDTQEELDQHDRLLRDNNWRVGVSATYSFEKMDVFGTYVEYVSGTDTHAGRAITFGVSFPFHFGN